METARTIRLIRLPSGKRVTLSRYVTIWQIAKEMARVDPSTRVRNWSDFPCYVSEMVTDLKRALHDRINQRGGLVVRESRASLASYSMARTPRVRIEPSRGRTFPPAARRALAHRIYAFED